MSFENIFAYPPEVQGMILIVVDAQDTTITLKQTAGMNTILQGLKDYERF